MVVAAKVESTTTALPKAAYVTHYGIDTMSEQSVTKETQLTAMDGNSVKYLSSQVLTARTTNQSADNRTSHT